MNKETHIQSVCRSENACAAYRRQEVSLSRAAELAGIGVYDFLASPPATGLQINLTPDDLRQKTLRQNASNESR